MSELKEWTASEIEEYDDARLELAEDGKIDCTRVYIKSDVDATIAELEEERRWINVDDKFPTADEGYILVLWEDGLPDIGYIGAENDVIETVRDRGEGHSVEWWKPLPSAPKEDK